MNSDRWPYNLVLSDILAEIGAVRHILKGDTNAILRRSLEHRLKLLTKAGAERSIENLIRQFESSGDADSAIAMRQSLTKMRNARTRSQRRRR